MSVPLFGNQKVRVVVPENENWISQRGRAMNAELRAAQAANISAQQSDAENFGDPIPTGPQSAELVTEETARAAQLTVSLNVSGAAPWLALIVALAIVALWALL